MIIVDVEQNTKEWDDLRLGIPTASSFKKIITSSGTHSKTRMSYMYQLAGERITGEKHKGYYGKAMELGHEREAESRKTYEFIRDVEIDQPGFIFKDEYRRYGCSPDGIIGDYGGFETKNAEPHIQAERLDKGWSVTDHHRQVMGCLLCTDFEWWDLVSYCRGMKPITIRVERDEAFLKILEEEVNIFCDELEELVKRIS